MSMIGNFEDPLKFKNGGRQLEVCGELFWDQDPHAERVIVSVTIRQDQNGTEVVARGTSPREFIRPAPGVAGDDEWMFFVTPSDGKRFKTGPATAVGVLTVMHPIGGGTEWRPDPDPPGEIELRS